MSATVRACHAGFSEKIIAPVDLVVIGPRGAFTYAARLTVEGAANLRDQLNIALDQLASPETPVADQG